MPSCPFCGYTTDKGGITCPICCSKLPDEDKPPPKPARQQGRRQAKIDADRRCPACGQTFTKAYADTFCPCGVELVQDRPLVSTDRPAPSAPPAGDLPPPGTCCLVLYDANRRPIHYFPLTKDTTLIGRQDAVAGNFPDIDLSAHLDAATARKVSRRHALVLHSRSNGSFALRPLAGNTGTQLEADMVAPQQDYPLEPGRRLILGGAVRFKFEVIS